MDSLIALAHNLQLTKGAYALLLGSGISRSASIPTGWEIVLDLIRRIARAGNEECGSEPDIWYRERFGSDPNYSRLVEQLGVKPAERSQTIRAYLEPTADERDRELKTPTEAHRAIARLIADGYLRVVITTNFDRLLEAALADVGVVPAVISTPDDAKGVLPLVHNRCTILKLHGDYTDARIMNTETELATYDASMQRILTQVLEEYGLVVCGWSGEWDRALVSALEKTQSPHFGTFWSVRSQPNASTNRLIECRSGLVIQGMDADGFFERLEEAVRALEETSLPENVSVAIAKATTKRYLDDPTKRIRLHDMVIGEVDRVGRYITQWSAMSDNVGIDRESILGWLAEIERNTEVLRTIMAVGSSWGLESHRHNWVSALERLAAHAEQVSPLIISTHSKMALERYPYLLALYSAGMAAVANGQYETLRSLLYDPQIFLQRLERRASLIRAFTPFSVLGAGNQVLGQAESAMPMYLFTREGLWDPIRELFPSNSDFISCYDRFEYLMGLAIADIDSTGNSSGGWGPVGAVAYRYAGARPGEELVKEINRQIELFGEQWAPLRAGMFGGSLDRLRWLKDRYDKQVTIFNF